MRFVDVKRKNRYEWLLANIRRRSIYLHPKRIRYIVVAGVVLLSLIPAGFVSQLLTKEARAITASQGPRFATATGDCVNDASLGTVVWTSPGNAFSTNSTYASVAVDGTTSNYIKCTNFGFSIPTGVTINGIVVRTIRKSNSTGNGGSQDAAVRLVQNGAIGATDRSTATIYTTADASEDHGTSTDLWGSTWTPADINAANFGAAIASKKVNAAGAAHTVTVDSVSITVYYSFNPTFSQSGYRWFDNQDASGVPINVGSPLSALNTPATVGAKETIFRLRLNVHVGNDVALAGTYHNFKLQYAQRGSDNSCDTGFVNETYADISASTPIAYADNTSAVDAQALAANANDPTHGSDSIVYQEYNEANNTYVVNSLTSGQDAMWDFALKFLNTATPVSYCLRLTTSAGAQLSSYSVVPEVALPYPVVSQANYRFFQNVDGTTPGAPLAAQDTAATVVAQTPFRLRQRLAVDSAQLLQSGQSYKLQLAEKTTTCSAVTNFTDLTSLLTAAGYAGVATQTGTGIAWDATLPTDAIGAPDSVLAMASNSSGTKTTAYITTSAHGITVPAGAVIKGIEVAATVQKNASVDPSSVRLMKAGAILSAERASSGTWPTSGTITWGGPNDLWGTTWTASDVMDNGFGASISALLDASFASAIAYVDAINVRVYYVDPSNLINYYDNVTPQDITATSSSGSDPTNGARPIVYQSYRETDPFTNDVAAIPAGSDGLWDFALIGSAAANGKTYCFRTVKSDGSLLDGYSQIPEITFGSGGGAAPTLDQQMRGGGSVINGAKGNLIW